MEQSPLNQNKRVLQLEQHGLEKVLPRGEISVYVATWNMNNKDPPDDVHDFLPPDVRSSLPEILVFGTQECITDKSWEIALQRTIGTTHVLFHSTVKKNFAIRLAIFVNRGLIWYCSEPETESSPLTWSPRSAKGAISIAFNLFDSKFLFITCHLAAHEEHLDDRLENVRDIAKHLARDYDCPDITSKFDYIFWSGDMNFRIAHPRGEVLKWIAANNFPLNQPAQNLAGEQLTSTMSDGRVYRGFREHCIRFPPTYKFDVGTDVYDTSHKLRTPSYTDRIVYKSRLVEDGVKCLTYDSIQTIRTSDHKPVYGVYKVKVNPIDKVSPTGGHYIRKVFIEAMREDEE